MDKDLKKQFKWIFLFYLIIWSFIIFLIIPMFASDDFNAIYLPFMDGLTKVMWIVSLTIIVNGIVEEKKKKKKGK